VVRRLESLEEQGRRVHLSYEGWPLMEQIEDVFCYLKLHANSGYRTTFGAVVVFAE
jgi:hypothetical protein